MGKIKKIWNILSYVLVGLIVLCAIFLMGSRIMGYQVYTVISGSMEPTYKVGDLLYVEKVDPAEVQVGDPITFVINENLVVATHRVIRIDEENQLFYTKGDANDIEDTAPVKFQNLIGIPRFRIAKLGYVSDFVQNPPGSYIAIGVGALLLIAVFLPDFLRKKDAVPEMPSEQGTQEKNAALRAELEALKAQLEQKEQENNDP